MNSSNLKSYLQNSSTSSISANRQGYLRFWRSCGKIALFTTLGLAIYSPKAWAHGAWFGNGNTFNYEASTTTLLQNNVNNGIPGFQTGDVFSISATFPVVVSGTTSGPGGYITAYIPPGTKVVGAEIINNIGNAINARPALDNSNNGINKGWGPRVAQPTFSGWNPTPLSSKCTTFGFTATNCKNGLAYIYGDTGIFYSTHADTAFFANGQSVISLTNGYFVDPTSTQPWTSVSGSSVNARVHNKWDALQSKAFGSINTTSLNGFTTAQETPISSTGTGSTPYLAGSPVAGADAGSPLDRSATTGPWQRISYPGSCIVDPATAGPATSTGGTGSDAVTGVNSVSVCNTTSAGVTLNTANPLPTTTNAVRFAVGGITQGELKYVRIKLQVTDPSLLKTVNFEAAGGDSTQIGTTTRGQDNPWRYWVGAIAYPSTTSTSTGLAINKQIVKVNGQPYNGSTIPPGAIVTYQITYANTWVQPQTNIVVSDVLPPATQISGVSNFKVISGPNILPTSPASPTPGSTFNFTTIPTLEPGTGGQVQFDEQVLTSVATNAIVANTARVASTQITSPVTSTASTTIQPTLINITGSLYQDQNGNDNLDSGENKLPANITLTLYHDDNNNNSIDTGEQVSTTVTNSSGVYTFNNVVNGSYKVKVDTSDPDISSSLTLGTSNSLAVNVAGSSVSNINFGFDLSQSCSTLYGSGTDGTNNRIYTLNPTAGATFLSNLSFGTNASARDPITGKIFYIEANSNNPRVATWDPATGTNAIINSTGFSTSVSGFTNNFITRAGFRADGALFIMSSNAFLYELNRDGTLKTSFGQVKQAGGVDIALSGGDLSFDSQGIMWLVSGGFLYVVDPSTPSSARAIEIGSLVSVPRVDGLAFVPDGTYYAHSSTTKATYTINTTTGVATATGGSVPSTISITDLSSCVYPTINLISGTLYQDGNGDNTFNSGETTQPANITVRLINASNNAVVATTTTRTGGTYIFSNVANGSYKVQVDTSDSDIPTTHKTLGTPNDVAVTVNNNNTTNVDFGFDRTRPNLLLVKRITAINGDRTQNLNDGTLLNTFVNDSSSTSDDDPHWFARNTYLIGAINGGRVKPGDEVEYTIYFLNTQAASMNVAICDLVPTQATFVSTGYSTASPHPMETGALPTDTGLALALDANTLPTTPTFYLTNTNDSDRGRYYPPSDPSTPSTCKKLDAQNNPISSGAAANTNGAIVVEIVRGTGTANQLPPATAAGTPPNSYGFIRFKAKVN